MRFLGASDESAIEVKIFNLSDFLTDRFRFLSDKFYKDNKQIAVKRSLWGILFAILGSLGYYAAYVFIIFKTKTVYSE